MRPTTNLFDRVSVLGMVGLVVLLTIGCQAPPPRGNTGARMDPYRATASDRASPKASGQALWEYSDQVVEKMARDLATIEQIRSAPRRVVLELGDLRNRTNTPTSDFELIQHRIRGNLITSKIIRDHFLVVEDPHRMDREKARLIGPGDTGTARYKPEDTYLLMGDFHEIRRGSTRRYYFEFKLTHVASREIVHNAQYDLAQR